MKTLMTLALIALTLPAWADVYRCTVDGRTVYTDRPCEGTKLQIRKDAIDESAAASELAILRRQIHVGMTADQVRRSWGPPNQVNRTLSGGGTHEQWVYRSPGSVRGNYVYLRDGVVTTIQN